MNRKTVNIYKVTRECGVRLVASREHSPASRRPFDCFCKPTVREIGQRWGEGHLRLVLMLMTGTRANARGLYADMMKAVARLLAGNPDLIRRPSLVDEFNTIDLGRLRSQAKAMRCGVPTSDVLLVLLSVKFKAVASGEAIETGEEA
ncbi:MULTISPECIES: hypothetical protein [unclassified Shinella]|uniref:hypothetical protein n=1 Tax=unclassified Shinella TaxID=2643062 RepID=UPI00225DBC2E|nr:MULTISPECIES: hypothetical protein [unclassified Shinella]MCO5140866.1 hypothetical protein [Shinella sp.]MDC7256444.1 hypothetical protein [Shinella sp. YE25]CAI0339311.1 conserved hypothetical protein [Rhizobiaceae bacterium]CAK7257720.1 conserved protein of unknown function [Shinella sp. WSC3-e]